MTRFALLAIAAFAVLASPAMAAGRVPGGGGLPVQPSHEQLMQRRMAAPVERAPYPMTYSEQVAQSLGVRNGRMDLIQSQGRNPYSPSVSLGGGMLRLRWNQ